MKRVSALFAIMALFVASETFSKGSRSSSSSRSTPSKSSSWSSKKSTPSKKATPSKTWGSKKSKNASTLKKSTSTKPKAIAPKTKAEKKLAKKFAGTDKAAATAYRQKMAASTPNKYTSATAPTQRPSHIPQTVLIGGSSLHTSYAMFPGGGYGYGYIDPMTATFIALQPRYYHVDPYQMRAAGYGNWDASGRPIVYRTTPVGLYIFLGIVLVCAIGGTGLWYATSRD